jgi:uncharacterized protein YjdB
MLKHILDFRWSSSCFSLSFVLVFCVGATAQTELRPEACNELGDGKDFVVVDENRGRLQRELPELKAKAKELDEKSIPQSEKAEKELKDTNTKIEGLKQVTPDLQKFKESLEDLLAGKSVVTLREKLKETNDLISWKETQLKCVNSDMRKLMVTPEQKFKGDMSYYFAIIIGVLILGFFAMGYLDEIVRRENFSGKTGLQFVTLFSIVIAIILFGITGILEAKELAALLGGLSGYILGSSTPLARRAEAGSTQNSGDGGIVPTAVSGIASVMIAPATTALTVTTPTQQLTATATDGTGNPITGLSNHVFQWVCDNTAVATVDQTGLVTRVAPGVCNVTAIANGQSSNACVVTCQ